MSKSVVVQDFYNKKITVTLRDKGYMDGSCFVQIMDNGNFAYLEEGEINMINREIKKLKEAT